MFANPIARLAGRALLAGLVSTLLLLQTASDWSSAWKGAVVAGVLAACEVLSPLNATVGLGKQG